MSIPVLSKSYAVKGNISFASNGSTSTATTLLQTSIWLLKQNLINGTITGGSVGLHSRNSNSVWTVLGSCDSSTQSINDGVDRWTTYTNVACATTGSAHSWILLHNATLGYDCLIDANAASTNVRVAFTKTSDATYTGGSTTTAPTSTSEFTAGSNSAGTGANCAFLSDTTTGGTNYAHFCTDDSGHWFYIMSRAGTNIFFTTMGFEQTVNAAGSDTRNTFGWCDSVSSARGAFAAADMNSVTRIGMRTINNVLHANGGFSQGGYFGNVSAPGAQGTDGGTSQYLAYPLHIYDFSGTPAYRGQMPDSYMVNMATVSGSYPSAAAQTHVIFGDMVKAFPDVNLLV